MSEDVRRVSSPLSEEDLNFINDMQATDNEEVIAMANAATLVSESATPIPISMPQSSETSVADEVLSGATVVTTEDGLPPVYIIGDTSKLTPVENSMLDILAAIYPGKTEYIIDDGLRTITIRFPELTVTNSKKLSRKIYENYVRISLGIRNNTLINFASITFTRSKLAAEELVAGYLQSHVSAFAPDENMTYGFRGVCLGSSDLLNLASSLSGSPMTVPIDAESFELYLYLLKNFFECENDEGVPYIRMENIHTRGFNALNMNINAGVIRAVARNLLNRGTAIPGLVVCKMGDISYLSINHLDEDFVSTLEGYSEAPRVAYIEEINDYRSLTDASVRLNLPKYRGKPLFSFRSKKILSEVIDYEDSTNLKYEIVLHPRFASEVARRLMPVLNSLAFNGKITRGSTITEPEIDLSDLNVKVNGGEIYLRNIINSAAEALSSIETDNNTNVNNTNNTNNTISNGSTATVVAAERNAEREQNSISATGNTILDDVLNSVRVDGDYEDTATTTWTIADESEL